MTTQFEFLPRGRRVYSVADLTSELKRLIEGKFPSVRVSGEISNARKYRSGHWYFTLKDKKAQISCVCFRGRARYLAAKPADGLAVIAGGQVSVYAQQGKYQLYVESLEPQGAGALQLEFERLKGRLKSEGLFDADRKRKIPRMPHRIGIVTSPTGAVIADMLRILERRFRGLHVRLFPVRVQGSASAGEIALGVRHFSDSEWADVVIVGRGGGSLEDLWSFNEESVARAIAASSVPVISAVGHETDFTIADFVADLRAPTPSAAAELAVPEAVAVRQAATDHLARASKAVRLRLAEARNALHDTGIDGAAIRLRRRIGEYGQRVDDADHELRAGTDVRLRRLRARLDLVERRLARLDLRVRLARQREQLGSLSARMQPAFRSALDRRASRLADTRAGLGVVRERLARESERLGTASRLLLPSMRAGLERRALRLNGASGRLDALSPLAILERGYSIVRTEAGVAVREHGQVAPGDSLSVLLHRGSLGVRVENASTDGRNRPPSGDKAL